MSNDDNNILSNGGFENTSAADAENAIDRGSWFTADSIDGWEATQGRIEIQTGAVQHWGVPVDATGILSSGAVLELDSHDAGGGRWYNKGRDADSTVEQSFTLDEAGSFELGFSYAARGHACTSDFEVEIKDADGNVLFNQEFSAHEGNLAVAWARFTKDLELDAGDYTLAFSSKDYADRDTIGALIDNVSLISTGPDTVDDAYTLDLGTSQILTVEAEMGTDTRTVAALDEDFSGQRRLERLDTIVDSDMVGVRGAAFSNACSDGVLEFAAVDVSTLADLTLSFTMETDGRDRSGFEAADSRYGDSIRVEISLDGGAYMLLDLFEVAPEDIGKRGDQQELVGSLSGQRFGADQTALSYTLPEGATTAQLRFVTTLTSTQEIIKIDDVLIEGEETYETGYETGLLANDSDGNGEALEIISAEGTDLFQTVTEDVTVFTEDFDGARRNLERLDTVDDSDLIGKNGAARADYRNDGELEFEEVNIAGLDGETFSFSLNASTFGRHNTFESHGRYRDYVEVQARFDDGSYTTIDTFDVIWRDGTQVFVGRDTGQEVAVADGFVALSYDLSALAGDADTAQLRLIAETTGRGEIFEVDDVSLAGTQTSRTGTGVATITLDSGAIVTINANGSFSYNANGQFAYLAEDERTTDSFSYTVSDASGNLDTAEVTINLRGANEGVLITNAVDSGAVTELTSADAGHNTSALTATGFIGFSDVDLIDTHVVHIAAQGTGYLGTLTASISDAATGDGTGAVTWDFAVDDADTNSLNADQVLTQSYQITVDDGQGGAANQTVTVTISGTNDAPTLAAAATSALEDGPAITLDLIALGNDVDSEDNGTSLTYTVSAAPSEGNASISGSTLSFAPGTDFQNLALNQTRDVTVQVTATDAQGASASNDITITVTGTNDAPTLAATTLAATEDGGVFSVDLAPFAGDVDSDNDASNLSYAIPGVPSEGSAVFNGSVLEFSTGADFQDLALGETRDVIVNTSVTDAHGAPATSQVTVTVTGTNDGPVIDATASDLSNASPTVVFDFDSGTYGTGGSGNDQNTYSQDGFTAISTKDNLTIGADLDGDGDLEATTSAKKNNEINFTLSNDDGQLFSVQGVNDIATPSSTGALPGFHALVGILTGGTRIEVQSRQNTNVAQSWDVSEIDVDNNETLLENVPDLASALNYLSDLTALEVRAGTANGAIRGFDDLQLRTATDATTASGQIVFSDVDTTDTHSAAITGVSASGADLNLGAIDPLGLLTLGAVDQAADTLGWSFDIDPALTTHLAMGETATLAYSVQISDNTGGSDTQTVTITVTGTNDAPTLAATTLAATEDGGVFSVDLAPFAGDVDSDNDASNLSYAIPGVPSEGSAVFNGSTLEFNTGADFQDLAAGETRDVIVATSVTDAHGAPATSQVTVTVTGTNDGPVAVADARTLSEDTAALSIDVLANDTDVDNGDTKSIDSFDVTGTLGTVTQTSSSNFQYEPGTVFQYLAVGETATDTFQYTVIDSQSATSTATVTLTITGSNDGPVANADINGRDLVIEAGSTEPGDATATGNALDNDTDIDASDVLAVSGLVAGTGAPLAGNLGMAALGTYGTLTITSTGTWTYALDDANRATEALAPGQIEQDVFTYEVSDGNGGTATALITIDVQGSEDNRPPVASDASESVNEDNILTGVVPSSDPDADDVLTHSLVTGPANGSLSFDTDGSYSYTPDPDFNGTDSFTYRVTDALGETDTGTVSLTIDPVNDAPVATPLLNGNASEDVPGLMAVQLLAGSTFDIDGDDLDAINVTMTSVNATRNISFTVDEETGVLRFEPSQFNDLSAGTSELVTITYDVVDRNGGAVPNYVEVTVHGANDAPAFVTGPVTSELTVGLEAAGSFGPEDLFDNYTGFAGQAEIVTLYGEEVLRVGPQSVSRKAHTLIELAAPGALGPDDVVTIDVMGRGVRTSGDQDYLFGITDGTGALTLFTTDTRPGADGGGLFADFVEPSGEIGVGYPLEPGVTSRIGSATGAGEIGAFHFQVRLDGASDRIELLTSNGNVVSGNTITDVLDMIDPANGLNLFVGNDGTGETAYFADLSYEMKIERLADSGTLAFTDVDLDDTHTASVTNVAISGANFGLTEAEAQALLSLSVENTDGSAAGTVGWAFAADDADFAALAEGEVLTIAYDITVDDNAGGSDTQVVTIQINGVNEAPVGEAASATGTEDTDITGQLVATDVDGDALTFELESRPANGAVSIEEDGSYTYTPNPDFFGTDSFTYTVTDEFGGTDSKTVSLTVTPVNDAPVAGDGVAQTTEDAGLSGTLADFVTDVDDDVPGAGGGDGIDFAITKVTLTSAELIETFLQTAGVSIPISIPEGVTRAVQYVGRDMDGDAIIAMVNDSGFNARLMKPFVNQQEVFLLPGNARLVNIGDYPSDPPTSVRADYTPVGANGGDLYTSIDSEVAFADAVGVYATVDLSYDAATGALSYQSIDLGTLSLDADTGAYTLVPGAGFDTLPLDAAASLNVTYEATDLAGASGTGTLAITVQGENDPVLAEAGSASGPEDTVITGQLVATDVDGDTLTFALGVGPAHGAVSIAEDGSYTYTPGPDFNGGDSFTYSVSDGKGSTDTQTVSLTITPVNDAPEAEALAAQVDAVPVESLIYAPVDTAYVIPNAGRFYVLDLDTGTSTTIARDFGANKTTAQIVAQYVSDNNALVVQVNPNNSGWGASAELAVDGVITSIDPSNFAITDTSGGSSNTATGGVAFGDDNKTVDSIAISVTGLALPGGRTADIQAAINDLRYEFSTTDNIRVDNVQFNAQITEPTDVTSVSAVFTDVDAGDTHTFSVDDTGTLGAVTDNGDGTFSYDADGQFAALGAGEQGTDQFTYTVTDAAGASDTQTVTVTVQGQNDAPTMMDVTIAGTEDTGITGQLTASDPDANDVLDYAVFMPGRGTLDLAPDGSFTYTPMPDFNGVDTITVSVRDSAGESALSTVSFDLAAVSDTPTLTPPTSAGGAYVSTRSTSYIEVAHDAALRPDDWTIEAWVQTTQDETGYSRILTAPVGGGQSYSLVVRNGEAHVRLDNGSGKSVQNTYVADGEWHHIAGTFDSTTNVLSLYVDGALTGTTNVGSAAPTTGTQPIQIGRFSHQYTGQGLEGNIADVRIWSETRDAAEIAGSFDKILDAASEPALELYLPLDGTAEDLSGKDRTVTPVNASFTGSDAPVDGLQVLDGGTLALTGLSVDDVDAADLGSDVQVTLTTQSGTIALGNLSGAAVISGANGSGTVTIEGTLAEVNAALATTAYTSENGAIGMQTITMTVDDLGTAGGGTAPTTASQEIDITVVESNIAATITGTATGAVTEDAVALSPAKLTAADGAAGDYFGYSTSVSADGSTIVVGAWGNDANGSDSGSAYVFDASGTQLAKLTAPDGAAGDRIGQQSISISADGSTIVVGAFLDDDKGPDSGSAYVFDVSGTQLAKLTAPDGAADDHFGYSTSVSADGGTIVVGAYRDDDKGSASGSVYVFDANGTQLAKLTAPDGAAGDRFGINASVSADGSTIVVGAYFDDDDGTNSGSVHTFQRNGDGDFVDVAGNIYGPNGIIGTQSIGGAADVVSGQLTVADPDTGEALLQEIAVGTAGDNGYGSFEVGADGAWSYTLDNASAAVQSLAEGDVVTDTITVTSLDGTATQEIEVTVTGTNDAPDVLEVNEQITELSGVSGSDQTGFVNVDGGGWFWALDLDTGTLSSLDRSSSIRTFENVANSIGMDNGVVFTINPNGGPIRDIDTITPGDQTDPNGNDGNFAMTSSSFTNGVETALSNSNFDLPTYTGYAADYVNWHNSHVVFDSYQGTIELNVEGIEYDGRTADVSFVVNGFSYAETGTTSVQTVDASFEIEAPAEPDLIVEADFSDVDSDTFVFTTDTTDTQGMVTNNDDGTFVYNTGGAFDALTDGQSATDSFAYTVTDDQGASETELVKICIYGADDFTFV
jgi:VCBS repeat-containing protein